jgi:tagatose 6-phosphate kinase
MPSIVYKVRLMILCLGLTPVYQRSMTLERVMLDDVNRASQVHDYASGKSINVARVLHALGQDPLITGFIGGTRGTMLCRDLDAAGLRHDFITVAPETRQCITVIDRAAGTATELVEESAPVQDRDWRALEQMLESILPKSRIWIFSGTLTPGAPPDFFARWLPLARQTGAIAIIDARGEPLRLAMQESNAILKMNRNELAMTLNRDLSEESRLIDAIRTHTPAEGKMIVTLGAAGALASDGRSCWRVISPRVRAISAIGSGDAFAAGLAAGIVDRKPFPEALQLAAACGAANAMTALAGHLSREDVERLTAAVVIEQG